MFLVSELIRKKREGQILSYDELEFLVDGFSNGQIPDYQITAWLMASFLCGLDKEETLSLTTLMRNSGKAFKWRDLSSNFSNAKFADKHSTGGVGDKVSLVLAPLAVCFGLKVPMMSGRGLGHTGGTVDKLESIPGFSMFPDEKTMIKNLDEVGTVMMAQSAEICPADKKLYSLRDVTATVESIPLITASIVSKKWAEGVDAIVYDVKCGSAAFMQELSRAQNLASSLVNTSKEVGMASSACITRMEEPLGSMIGNAVEVEESLWILEDSYPSKEHQKICQPLRDLCCELAAEMAVLAELRHDKQKAVDEAHEFLSKKQAIRVFEDMALAQGAHANWRESLPKAKKTYEVKASSRGTLTRIDSRRLGVTGLELGIGRKSAEDSIDPSAGIEVLCQVGQKLNAGEILCKVHLNDENLFKMFESEIVSSFHFDQDIVSIHSDNPSHLFIEKIS